MPNEFLIIHIGICHTAQTAPTKRTLLIFLKGSRSSRNPLHAISSTNAVISRYIQLVNSDITVEYVFLNTSFFTMNE